MASKLLITDAYTSMGRAILAAFEHTAFSLLAPKASELDWCDTEQLADYIEANNVTLVINTRGWSEAPDAAEQLQLVDVAKSLAEACVKTGVVPLHLSSYRVFGGENKTAYDEQDKPSPLGSAGRAFLEAERCFERHLTEYICLRIGWVIDVQGESYLSRMLSNLTMEGGKFEVGHQRRGAPVSTDIVGRVVLAMVNQILCGSENWGIFHCASSDPCTVAEFTDAVASILDQEGQLLRPWAVTEPVAEDAELAYSMLPEPDSSVLSVRRSRDNFGIQSVSWRKGLKHLVNIWLERKEEQRLHEQSS